MRDKNMTRYVKKIEDGKEVIYEKTDWAGTETRIGEIKDRPWGERGIGWGAGSQNSLREDFHERNSESRANINGRDGTFKYKQGTGYEFEEDRNEEPEDEEEDNSIEAMIDTGEFTLEDAYNMQREEGKLKNIGIDEYARRLAKKHRNSDSEDSNLVYKVLGEYCSRNPIKQQIKKERYECSSERNFMDLVERLVDKGKARREGNRILLNEGISIARTEDYDENTRKEQAKSTAGAVGKAIVGFGLAALVIAALTSKDD